MTEDEFHEKFQPLFDLVLQFEQYFAEKALNEVGATQEEIAAYLETSMFGPENADSETVTTFRAMLKQVEVYRMAKSLSVAFEAVRKDGEELLTISEIFARKSAKESKNDG